MKQNKSMKMILHTHWDREWYFSVEETQMYLRFLVQNVFEFLEKNPDVKYLFDGQSVMIDDMCKYYEDVNKYEEIISKQIDLGPWYTQTDLVLPKDESIVRNLYYGLKKAREYSKNPMMIGYAPDTFGHNPQMPQIYRGFGIDSTIFWRGYSKKMSESNVFDWVGIDGSQVKAMSLPAGYQGAKYLPEKLEELKERIDTILKKYKKFNSDDKVLLMNGHDQMPIQKNIKDILDSIKQIYPDYEISISDLRSYVNQYIGKEADKVYGYLDHGDFTRVHRTIGSTRIDIKALNRKNEQTIYEILEPLSIIADKYNIRYPNLLIEKTLKELMGVHAHDSIGGCNTDEVNEDIKHRISRVQRLIDNHIYIAKRSIANSISTEYNIFVYNLLPFTVKDEIVEAELIVDELDFCIKDDEGKKLEFDIISCETVNMRDIDRQVLAKMLDICRQRIKILVKIPEIKGLDVLELKLEKSNSDNSTQDLNGKIIEDDNYVIEVENKVLSLYIKTKGVKIKNFISIENSGDDGDSYDYSPPLNDVIYGEKGFDEIEILSSKKYKLFSEMDLIVRNNLPFDLEDRFSNEQNVKQEYLLNLRLFNDGNIKLKVKFVNDTIEHRSRLRVKSSSNIESILAGCQYGYIDIKNDYELEEISVRDKWVEKAVNVYNFQDKVIHKDNLSVTSRLLNEFEYKSDELYLTLIRSYSFMGKSNLVNRPNRASGMNLLTPEARLLDQKFEFEFNINYISQSLDNNRTKLIAYQNKEYNRFNININRIGKQNTKIELPFEELNITAFKKAENADDLILRVYNPCDEKVIKLDTFIGICDFEENELEKVKEFKIGKNEVKTIKIYKE